MQYPLLRAKTAGNFEGICKFAGWRAVRLLKIPGKSRIHSGRASDLIFVPEFGRSKSGEFFKHRIEGGL